MNTENIKVIAMDLDGTLTQHKQPLCPENRAALEALAQKYRLLMVGAGQVMRIFRQLEGFPIDIIGNYGMQYGQYQPSTGEMVLKRDDTRPCDSPSVERRVAALRKAHQLENIYGDSVEYHPSGCLTFPCLGTKAPQDQKLAYDPDRKKRRAIYPEVCKAFPDYIVFVGGSSSFDLAPAPYNKYYALDLYCKEKGLSHENVVYIGDDYGPGGNDESVYVSDIPFLTIDDYRTFPELVEQLL